MSDGCLKEVAIIHRKGKTITTPTAVSTAYRASASTFGALILIAPRQHPQLHHGDSENECEEHHGHCRCVAHLVRPTERFLVHVQHQAEGAIERSTGALRRHVLDLAEDLERADRAGDGQEHDRWIQ